MPKELTIRPEDLLHIYRQGLFPMADSFEDPEFAIIEPYIRGILPIFELHIPHSLRKLVRKFKYNVRINTNFEQVMLACAESKKGRESTWINQDILALFCRLNTQGHAHSVEVYDDQNNLIGGLYGLAMGQVFCGESMFSRAPNVSKLALVHLCARLWHGGFKMLDAQFPNEHLEQFGAKTMLQDEYVEAIAKLLDQPASFALPQDEQKLVSDYLDARAEAAIF